MKLPARFVAEHVESKIVPCESEKKIDFMKDFLGESPQFNEAFEFEIAFPELALVRFVVLDDESLDYDFIGQYTLPFDCIQPG